MPFVILPTNSISGGYDITNSLRFNKGSSDYLSRIPASAGSTTKGTFSLWFKISELSATRGGAYQMFYSVSDGGSPFFISIDNNDNLFIGQYNGSSWDFQYTSTQVLRDVSAWYHIFVGIDTTQATASNRVRTYLNGSEVTSWGVQTNPSSSLAVTMFKNSTTEIGRYAHTSGQYYAGYIAEQYGIDGQQLTPSSFGETDFDTGIWKPKAYTGTYGTNGFYLQFKNSASLGTDSSGNGNTFTVNNLTSIDQTTDTPTNNFATWNPLVPISNISFSEGNLKASTSSTSKGARTTIASSTGKWYFENKLGSSAGNVVTGIAQDISNFTYVGSDLYSYGHYAGNIYNNGSTNTYTGTASNNDIVSIGLDLNNNKMYVAINGTWLNSADPSAGTGGFTITSGNYHFAVSGDTSQSWEGNFGNPSFTIASGNTDGAGFGNFEYAVPSGYYSLNTKNLATFG
jgi:hypothetical protein